MKNFVLLLFFTLFISSLNAKGENSESEMKILAQKVDSLDHELAFLKISYELHMLNAEINTFINQVDIKSTNILLFIADRHYTYDLWDKYKKLYESSKRNKESIYELINAKGDLLYLMSLKYNFSKSEQDNLIACYSAIKSSFNLLDISLDYLKSTLEVYKKHI